ncbi:MAG: RnfABCDGE type electron transport complex subunit C, partial [Eubacteriales bacterium]
MILKGKRYRYGVHVKDRKELCREKPIETMPAPETVKISVSQHIGAPAAPVVNVGDDVIKGQMIAEATGAVSANVFSSVCGKVTGIEEIVNPMGLKQKYIVIQNDGRTEEFRFPNLENFEDATIIGRVREAGIVGLGGAGFPTAVKLSPKNPLDTLIVNGAECEPYLNCDYRLMIEHPDEIVKGINYLAAALNVKNVVVGIEKNKPEAIELFSERGMNVVALQKQYPMGSEKQLIYCCT